MAKLSLKAGTTSKLLRIFVSNSSVTTGAGLTGLVFNSGSLIAYYIKEGDATTTAITLATMTVGTWATGGFKEVDATHMPGVYEIGIPNAALASGASVLIMLSGATNMAPVLLEIELTAVDNQSATAFVTSVPALATAGNNAVRDAIAAKVIGTAPTANTWDEAMAFAQAGIGKNNVAYTPPSGVNTANGVMAVKANDGVATLKTFSAVNQDASGNITSRA